MLSKIRLENFRSYKKAEFSFSSGITVVSGPNGSGKTNLLEAVWLILKGRSFKSNDEVLLRNGTKIWRLEAVHDNLPRVVSFDLNASVGRKQFKVNDQKKFRLPPDQKLPVVLFEPDDLRLLNGSPKRRRDYLDNFISNLVPAYHTELNRFERALKQRNNLLKNNHLKTDELFVWDMVLAEAGCRLMLDRRHWINQLDLQLNKAYNQIAKSQQKVSINYLPSAKTETRQGLLSQFHKNHQRDKLLGFTSLGPHRDDFEINLDKRSASQTASRGEIRTIVLALKLIELQLIEQHATRPPILLLDDVFSELDKNRRQALLKVSPHLQTIITTTNADTLSIKSAKHKTIKL